MGEGQLRYHAGGLLPSRSGWDVYSNDDFIQETSPTRQPSEALKVKAVGEVAYDNSQAEEPSSGSAPTRGPLHELVALRTFHFWFPTGLNVVHTALEGVPHSGVDDRPVPAVLQASRRRAPHSQHLALLPAGLLHHALVVALPVSHQLDAIVTAAVRPGLRVVHGYGPPGFGLARRPVNLRVKLLADYYVGGTLQAILKPATVLLGKVLRRDHDLARCSSLTFIKMMGGGSLVIAYPALLATKNSPQVKQLRLITTSAVKPFAEILGVFDEIIVIRDDSAVTLLGDSLTALRKLFRCDAIVDLEVHSRLTTVFSVVTCAVNRVGFYTGISFWRQKLATHLLFCNISSGIYYFYDQIAALFGGAAAGHGNVCVDVSKATGRCAAHARCRQFADRAGALLLRIRP